MKLLLLGLLLALVACQNNEVDAVLQLLSDMKSGVSADIKALDAAWQRRQASKQDVIDTLSLSAQEQRSECQKRDQDVQSKQSDIDVTNSYIKWMLNRQTLNGQRVHILEESRCRQTNNYVGDIKNNKVALALVQFLKRELSRVQENELSLIQRNTWGERIRKFMNIYKSGRLLSMVQNLQVDEQGEIVVPENVNDEETLLMVDDPDTIVIIEDENGNVVDPNAIGGNAGNDNGADQPAAAGDNNNGNNQPSGGDEAKPTGGQGHVDEVPETKEGLVGLLNELENHVRMFLSQSQEDEVRSGLTFIDFKIRIEQENITFDQHVTEERENVNKYTNHLKNRISAAALCNARLFQITVTLQVVQEDMETSRQSYEELRKSKEEELSVFEEVHRIYQNQVASGGDQYKKTVEENIRR